MLLRARGFEPRMSTSFTTRPLNYIVTFHHMLAQVHYRHFHYRLLDYMIVVHSIVAPTAAFDIVL